MSNEAKLFNHLAQHNVARLQIDFKGDYEQYDDDDWGFHVNTKAEAVNAKGETVDLDDIDEIDILWNDGLVTVKMIGGKEQRARLFLMLPPVLSISLQPPR